MTIDNLIVNSYEVPGCEIHSQIYIERKTRPDGPARWAIVKDPFNLNKDLEWEYEPLPSSRDDEFFARCRYDSVDEALLYLNNFIAQQ